MRLLIALNMFILHLLTGQADLTISGWSYIRLREGKWTPIKFIDWLFRTFTGQEDHCRKAFVWEINESHNMVNTYRKYLQG
ncbi:hypothetical protein VPH1254_0021 [Vibrio phage 1254]|nr:hypothetical protein SIPHO018v1_100021 [Vibrio phage 11E33.1]QZI86715.1 hypothetical protein SIPHO019v1_40002 [Vibrio phage 82E32.1]QZI92575.1 hypothetical protein SIPHO017v1_p0042 [Vibrio phage 19E33.1]QZI92940.1 hypothetical protein SIPHO015v1_p0002 [Vibrio phage 82E32.2]QZI93041.1 hypothetical protein SIPHO014v1_p0042 [Vibrio phage 82E32.3]QZI93088.1 hypothetical protein SIPHO013v1_p0027 [Vibrio phage 82E33.2]